MATNSGKFSATFSGNGMVGGDSGDTAGTPPAEPSAAGAEHNLAFAALTRHAHDRGRVALVWEGADARRETYTFFDLEQLSNRVANALSSLGVKRGDRVFTLLGRTPTLYAALPGALKLGAAVGALFTDFGPEAIRQRLHDAGARVVITDAANFSKLAAICHALPALEHITVAYGGAPVDGEALTIDNLRDARPRRHDFVALMQAASPEFATVAVEPDETCFFIYTSGTAGLPKGVVHRHAIGERLAATADEVLSLAPDDFYWCSADPGWVTGLCYGIFAPWLVGRPILVDEGEFDAARWLRLLDEHQVTCWYTTPTLLRRLMCEGELLARAHSFALRRIYSVGEPLNPEVIAWVERVFGAPVYDSYWQTETGAQVIANRPGVSVRRGSMGKAVAGVRAAVVDERGREVPDGTIGDIALNPALASLFKGYWNFPDATRACFRAGWYITRDRGRRDADGYFWFVGRDDDVITCAAQRVGPFEVESALLEHPAVAESAVVGVPDAVTTERVKAFVVLHTGHAPTRPLAEEIAAHVRAQLSPLACPREIEFCAELPKTRSGKIQRARLRQSDKHRAAGQCFTLS